MEPVIEDPPSEMPLDSGGAASSGTGAFRVDRRSQPREEQLDEFDDNLEPVNEADDDGNGEAVPVPRTIRRHRPAMRDAEAQATDTWEIPDWSRFES